MQDQSSRLYAWRPNLHVVKGPGRRQALNWVSGTVVDRASPVTWAEGSRAPLEAPTGRLSSEGTARSVCDELYLRDSDGRLHVVALDELQVAVRPGDEVTVMWAAPGQAGVDACIVVRNHSGASTYFDEEALLGLFLRQPKGAFWAVLLICTCFTPLLLGVPWFLLKRRRAHRAVLVFKNQLEFVRD
jgi:hypothetical protein